MVRRTSGGGAGPQMFIVVIWPQAVFHSFYESSHSGQSSEVSLNPCELGIFEQSTTTSRV